MFMTAVTATPRPAFTLTTPGRWLPPTSDDDDIHVVGGDRGTGGIANWQIVGDPWWLSGRHKLWRDYDKLTMNRCGLDHWRGTPGWWLSLTGCFQMYNISRVRSEIQLWIFSKSWSLASKLIYRGASPSQSNFRWWKMLRKNGIDLNHKDWFCNWPLNCSLLMVPVNRWPWPVLGL